MKQSSGRAFLFVAAMLAAAASPLVAQQASVSAPSEQAAPVPATPQAETTQAAPLAGPRVREFQPAESRFKDSQVSRYQEGQNHTIVITTLALVLVVVIVVLLIAR